MGRGAPPDSRIAIIGGGIAGLTAALRLAQAGRRVSVFEKWPEVGGQAGTFPLGGTRLERFYHHVFRSDREILPLIQELGLGPQLQWLPSRVGFFHGGRIHPFVTPLDLLRFRPISLIDRVRLGAVGVYLQRYEDWRRLEGITAKDWITRYAGRRNYRVVWGPLLRAKFGDRHQDVGMVWFWGKIHLRFASRGQGGWRESLAYMKGSFGVLTDTMAREVERLGGEIHTATPVDRILVEGNRAIGVETRGQARAFETVLATVPSPIFLGLAPDLPQEYARKVAGVHYQAAICLVLELDRPFTDIYWLNISDAGIPFVGVIEQTNFVPVDCYGGRHPLYITNYLPSGDPFLSMGPREVLAAYLPHLKRIQPAFREEWTKDLHLFKEEGAQPIVTANYSRLIPDHRTPIGGLYLANTTQIYPEDRGMNYSVRLGEWASRLILEDLAAISDQQSAVSG
ncbi:MAG TPA: NAD(P)/FAD-dependent oxidoreductase [Dehalococcoidia bacterium]|nr:NAD(P)/FAD-dependent oxidoreductase [Dehalococcoidia bacterium]